MNLLDKAVLEIGAGTGLLSIVACLLGESISGVSNLSELDRVLPHTSANELTPASQCDLAESSLLIFESGYLAVRAQWGMQSNAR